MTFTLEAPLIILLFTTFMCIILVIVSLYCAFNDFLEDKEICEWCPINSRISNICDIPAKNIKLLVIDESFITKTSENLT